MSVTSQIGTNLTRGCPGFKKRQLGLLLHIVRDAEMTIQVFFERSSQKGGRQGVRKEGQQGPTLKFYCRPKAQGKQHFGKSHFYCRRLFPGNTVTIILDNYPPSTLQGVGLGGRKNPRFIVGEHCCHFGASYIDLKNPSSPEIRKRTKAFTGNIHMYLCLMHHHLIAF